MEIKNRIFFYLAFIFLIFGKILYTFYINSFGLDGSYYFNIAENIKNGLGFVTNISLYHQGFSELPHPSSVYPIWPRILGYLGRIVSIDVLAIVLPNILYFATLGVLYKLGMIINSKPIYQKKYFTFYTADVICFLFALHTEFLKSTSKPYTEAFTYFLLAIFIFRLYQHTIRKTPILYTVIETAILTSLLIQTRSQMVILVFAFLFLYCFWLVFHKKIVYKVSLLVYGVFFFLFYLPQLFFLKIYFGEINSALLLFFDQVQTSQELSKLDVMVKKSNLFNTLLDRSIGLGVAFKPWGEYSYINSFHGIQYVLFLFPLVFIYSKNMLKQIIIHFKKSISTVEVFPFYFFIILFALISFASLHLLHKNMWATWNFSTRHSFIITPIFILCFLYLHKHLSHKWKIFLNLVFIIYVTVGITRVFGEVYDAKRNHVLYEKKLQKMITFINSQKNIIIAMENPQKISRFTKLTNYHWIYEKTTKIELEYLFKKLDTKLLILHKNRIPKFKKQLTNFYIHVVIDNYCIFKLNHIKK